MDRNDLPETLRRDAENAAETAETDADIKEDKNLLSGQLRVTQFACEEYDAEMAYEALDLLLKEKWKRETVETLRRIRKMIYLHSDFENAAEICEKMAG